MPTSERDVLTSLPDTRPTRRSAKRPAVAGGSGATQAATKPKAAAKPKATATAKPKTTASPKAAAQAKAAAKPKGASKIGVPKGQSAPEARVHEELPPGSIPAAGWDTNTAPAASTSGGFNTDDLAGTALSAVSQIVQIGLTSVSNGARSLLDKLPRP